MRAALEELPYDFVAAHLVGGTEKLRGDADYGVALATDSTRALDEHRPELVVDLSDEPVLGPRRALPAREPRARGRAARTSAPTSASTRPQLEPFPLPSIGIVGTGKRVGKTAITAHAAHLLARERKVVVVAMGRGGPPEPEVAEVRPTSSRCSSSRAPAATPRPTTSRRRRSGRADGRLPALRRRARRRGRSSRTCHAGARMAPSSAPDLVLFDGSGAAMPPVETARRILVVNGATGPGRCDRAT